MIAGVANEANVIVNGHQLTVAQSRTVRIALAAFYLDLQQATKHAFDEVLDSYMRSIEEINGMIGS